MGTQMKSVKLAVPLLVMALVSGCGFLFGDKGVFRDKSEDYKKAREVPELRLPEGEQSTAMGEMYPIPPITDNIMLQGKFEVPRPEPLSAGGEEDKVRIQTLGDESWVLISSVPGQVWPQVRAFLATSQIPLGRVDARAGIIETAWVNLEGQSLPSRFQFRIDQGVQRGTSEMHVLQMSQTGDAGSDWPKVSSDPSQENEMLRSVAQFLANSADSTPVSMVAEQAISATGKISIQEGEDDDIYIRLGLPFDRAWASVGRAIEESNFEITDRDRSAGKYYVRFLGTQSEEESGWFDWMLGSDDDPLVNQQFVISVETLAPSDMAIRIEYQGPAEDAEAMTVEKRDELSLLTLLKDNID
jgi:outer membrane protein assembly factor BamC